MLSLRVAILSSCAAKFIFDLVRNPEDKLFLFDAAYMIHVEICKTILKSSTKFELRHEKTKILHMRKQRRRQSLR